MGLIDEIDARIAQREREETESIERLDAWMQDLLESADARLDHWLERAEWRLQNPWRDVLKEAFSVAEAESAFEDWGESLLSYPEFSKEFRISNQQRAQIAKSFAIAAKNMVATANRLPMMFNYGDK